MAKSGDKDEVVTAASAAIEAAAMAAVNATLSTTADVDTATSANVAQESAALAQDVIKKQRKRKRVDAEHICDWEIGEDETPCGLAFTTADYLLNHKNSVHRRIALHVCDFKVVKKGGKEEPCGQSFSTERALKTHKQVVHGQGKREYGK